MKRGLAIGLALLTVCSWAAAAWAADLLPAEVTLRTNARLRTEPTEDSASLMILMKGQTLTAVDAVGRWLRVEHGRFTGYIRCDLIEGDSPESNPARGNEPLATSGGERPTLRMGARNDAVKDLQRCLASLGYAAGNPDGIFGETTRAAVIAFQKDHQIVSDGIVGTDTYRAIDAVIAELAAYGAPAQSVGP